MTLLSASGVEGLPPVVEQGRSGQGRRQRPYYVMPWYRRGSLDKFLRSPVQRDLLTILDFLSGCVNVLHSVHSAGVAHRDVKPENILLTDNGLPLLADFGLCLQIPADDEPADRLTEEWRAIGPRLYLAPEMEVGFNSDADHRPADFWSFAKVMWVVLTGRSPLSGGDQLEARNRLANAQPELQNLDALFEQMLQRDPASRLNDWSVVSGELEIARVKVDPLARAKSSPVVPVSLSTEGIRQIAATLRTSPTGVRLAKERAKAERERRGLGELEAATHRAMREGDDAVDLLNTELAPLLHVALASGSLTLPEAAQSGIFDHLLRGAHGVPLREEVIGGERSCAVVTATFEGQNFYLGIGVWLLKLDELVYPGRIPYLFGHPASMPTVLYPPRLMARYGRLYDPVRLDLESSQATMVEIGTALLGDGMHLVQDAISLVAAGGLLEDPDAWSALYY